MDTYSYIEITLNPKCEHVCSYLSGFPPFFWQRFSQVWNTEKFKKRDQNAQTYTFYGKLSISLAHRGQLAKYYTNFDDDLG